MLNLAADNSVAKSNDLAVDLLKKFFVKIFIRIGNVNAPVPEAEEGDDDPAGGGLTGERERAGVADVHGKDGRVVSE